MSLIVSVLTREGIVMASDSRSTFLSSTPTSTGVVEQTKIPHTDSTYKTFLVQNKIGVSTCGTAHISGLSIGAHIQHFVNTKYNVAWTLSEFSDELAKFFLALSGCGDVIFHIAGFETAGGFAVPTGKRLVIKGDKGKHIVKDMSYPSFYWDGQTDVLLRLVKSAYFLPAGNSRRVSKITITSKKPDGAMDVETLEDRIIIPGVAPWKPDVNILCDYFTLQDGVDFAKFAIQTTIDAMHFQAVPKTVGGPIDILVITPSEARWVAHKELHA